MITGLGFGLEDTGLGLEHAVLEFIPDLPQTTCQMRCDLSTEFFVIDHVSTRVELEGCIRPVQADFGIERDGWSWTPDPSPTNPYNSCLCLCVENFQDCCTAKSAGHACKVHKRVYTTANSLLSTSTMTNEQGARDELNCWIFVLWRPKEKSSFITLSLRDKTDIVVRVEIRENLHDVYRRLHYWRKINNMDKSSATA